MKTKHKDPLYPLRRLHGWLHEKKNDRKNKKALQEDILIRLERDPNAALLVLTADHGNIGDHGIGYAETKLLQEASIPFIELPVKYLYAMRKHKLLHLMNGRTIIFNGGGYLGTLWFNEELTFRDTIIKNPDSKIIMLPNTIFYEDNDWGRQEFKKSIDIYNKHPALYLYARESTSYQIMKDAYPDARLIPDVVLSLDGWDSNAKRHGCLLCLRTDWEKTMSSSQSELVHSTAKELFGDDVRVTDMVRPTAVDIAHRKTTVEDKFREFSEAELVITDRLHGMIFCAITGTPCIVLDSKSPKVRGCYEWIKGLPYIRFADDASMIPDEFSRIPKTEHRYDNSHLDHYFRQLKEDLQQMMS